MKRTFKSYDFCNDYFCVDIENKSGHIEISKISERGRKVPHKPEDVISALLSNLKDAYSDIETRTPEGRKKLAKELEQRIKDAEDDILHLKLAIQMCRKKKALFIEEK